MIHHTQPRLSPTSTTRSDASRRWRARRPLGSRVENDRFKEESLDSFDVIPGQADSEQADEGGEEDRPATNPLRLHRLMRNQRESVAHFVSGRAFLPARNERTVRQQHHCPRSGVPPPSGFLFSIEEENE